MVQRDTNGNIPGFDALAQGVAVRQIAETREWVVVWTVKETDGAVAYLELHPLSATHLAIALRDAALEAAEKIADQDEHRRKLSAAERMAAKARAQRN